MIYLNFQIIVWSIIQQSILLYWLLKYLDATFIDRNNFIFALLIFIYSTSKQTNYEIITVIVHFHTSKLIRWHETTYRKIIIECHLNFNWTQRFCNGKPISVSRVGRAEGSYFDLAYETKGSFRPSHSSFIAIRTTTEMKAIIYEGRARNV